MDIIIAFLALLIFIVIIILLLIDVSNSDKAAIETTNKETEAAQNLAKAVNHHSDVISKNNIPAS